MGVSCLCKLVVYIEVVIVVYCHNDAEQVFFGGHFNLNFVLTFVLFKKNIIFEFSQEGVKTFECKLEHCNRKVCR